MNIIDKNKKTSEQKQDDQLMLLKTSPRRFMSLNEERTHSFNLIWIDECAEENNLDSLRTRTLLREINNDNCSFFNQPDKFMIKINELEMKHQNILVIMSGLFAKTLLDKLCSLDSILIIIIFCANYNRYAYLLSRYSKVAEICTTYEKLQSTIRNEILSSKFNLSENQFLKTVRPLNSKNGIENHSAYYSYMTFIELLRQMPQTPQAKENMLKKCRDYYRGDKTEQKKIEDFRITYQSDKAIEWYIKNSFVYRLVNRAFRTEDITLWYAFRYFVVDLCQQLEKVHKDQNILTSLKLYRYQSRMSISEFEYFKDNIGCFVSTNGFFSSAIDITAALAFKADGIDTDDSKTILFEITVDGINLQNTVFVDIDQYTGEPYESEVLFNIGSVFQIENVSYHPVYNIWMIKMTATDEGTHDIKKSLEEKKEEFRPENINLIFGRLLIEMNEYAKAESYFQMLLQELPKSHQDIPLVYHYIGNLNMRSTDWNEAWRYFDMAYQIKKKILPSNHSSIGVILNNLGNYYKAIKNYPSALRYYNAALQCIDDECNRVRTQINIAAIYLANKDFDLALDLCFKAHDILYEKYPHPYEEILQCLGVIGDIYFMQKKYNNALDYYLTALEMSKKVLPLGHRLRITCIVVLANLYHDRGMKNMAISFCQNKLFLYEKYLPEWHINIAYLLMKLGELYEDDDIRKIDSLQRALRIFERSIHLEYASTADCIMMIAEYYKKQNGYDSAFKYYRRALEIQTKIYPKDHSIILQTQSIIDAGQNET